MPSLPAIGIHWDATVHPWNSSIYSTDSLPHFVFSSKSLIACVLSSVTCIMPNKHRELYDSPFTKCRVWVLVYNQAYS